MGASCRDRLVLGEFYIAATLSGFADHLGYNLFPSLKPLDGKKEAGHRRMGRPVQYGLFSQDHTVGGESLELYNVYAALATVISKPVVYSCPKDRDSLLLCLPLPANEQETTKVGCGVQRALVLSGHHSPLFPGAKCPTALLCQGLWGGKGGSLSDPAFCFRSAFKDQRSQYTWASLPSQGALLSLGRLSIGACSDIS